MTPHTFETDQFRVQITGRTVWVESREDQSWILRNQHNLPVPERDLQTDEAHSVLRAALEHFELAHPGDGSLRHMLSASMLRIFPKPAPKPPAIVRPATPRVETRPKMQQRMPRLVDRFRAPLRPPLARTLVAAS